MKRPVTDPEGSKALGAWRSWGCLKQGEGESRGFLSGLPLFLWGPCVYHLPHPVHRGETETAPKQPCAGMQHTVTEATEGTAGLQAAPAVDGCPQRPGRSAPGRTWPSATAAEMPGEGLGWPKSWGLPTTVSEQWLREERQPQTLTTSGEVGAPGRHHGGKTLHNMYFFKFLWIYSLLSFICFWMLWMITHAQGQWGESVVPEGQCDKMKEGPATQLMGAKQQVPLRGRWPRVPQRAQVLWHSPVWRRHPFVAALCSTAAPWAQLRACARARCHTTFRPSCCPRAWLRRASSESCVLLYSKTPKFPQLVHVRVRSVNGRLKDELCSDLLSGKLTALTPDRIWGTLSACLDFNDRFSHM